MLLSLWRAATSGDPRDVWQPGILVVALLLQAGYLFLFLGPGRRRLPADMRPTVRQTLCFLGSMWLMYVSFAGPLDYLSDNYLFSAHMIQHMIEIKVMVPLVLLGLPAGVFRRLMRARLPGALVRALTQPAVAGFIFNAVLTVFHFPGVYNEMLLSDSFHLFSHIAFFVIGCIFWFRLIVDIPELPVLTPGKRLLYLLYNFNLMMPLVVVMLASGRPWYAFYVHAPRVLPWLTPLGDMQLGAIFMALSMVLAYGFVAARAYARQDEESVWYA